MSLFQKSSPKNRRLKVLVWGPTGTGKTIFALTFPKCRVIDMEGGMIHYEGRQIIPEQSGDFEIMRTGSAMKVLKAVEQTMSEIAAHLKDPENVPMPCETLVIDPMTTFWQRLQEAYVEQMDKGNDFNMDLQMREWAHIKRPLKNLITDLEQLPIHTIMTAHEGDEYEKKGKDFVVVGLKPKVEGDTPYSADTVLQFLSTDGKVGNRVLCHKDRSNVLERGKIYENVTYKTWSEYFSGATTLAHPAAAAVAAIQSRDEDVGEDRQLFARPGPDNGDDKNAAGGENASDSPGDGIVETLINEPVIKEFIDKELDWPLAKRRAMARRFKDKGMDAWKAFIKEAIREARAEKAKDAPK
jgi:hypothetical protein